MLRECGYHLVLWDNMPLHFIQPYQWTIAQIYENTIPGSVIVLLDDNRHDAMVASIVDTIIPMFKEQEFSFIKIEDMIRDHSHGR